MSTPPRVVPHLDGQPRPYSAAVYGGMVFPCGQVPVRSDGTVPESIGEQVDVCLDNLERLLLATGSSLDHLLQITVYLADLSEFDAYNVAYLARLTGRPLPPRTTVQVGGFRGDKRMEISAVAAVAADSTDERTPR